jgi:hypothetical protein
MSQLKLFLQFEGHRPVELIQVSEAAVIADVLAAAASLGAEVEDAFVFLEFEEAPLTHDKPLLGQGVRDKARVHVHRCKRIRVALNFPNEPETHHEFAPSATVAQVKAWYVDKLKMPPVDATDHVLQLAGTKDRPDPDVQVGALVHGSCEVSFTLVPIKRVEG